jgi:hypothetical protein
MLIIVSHVIVQSSHCSAVRNDPFSNRFKIHLSVKVAGYSVCALPAQLVLSFSNTTQSPTVRARFHAITVESILPLPPKSRLQYEGRRMHSHVKIWRLQLFGETPVSTLYLD